MVNRRFLFATVFLSGMSVMAVELTASRLLAPYFGASLFVWTNLIGVVLLALSLGYYWGGKWADRNGGREAGRTLFLLIFTTGILVSLIPALARSVFRLSYEAMPGPHPSVFLPSLLSILALFTLPLLFLGMVTPLAARIGLKGLDSAGRVVGELYAFSTVGSILGTFLPVLLTIPYLGSRETFFLFGGLLILLGTVGLGRRGLLVFLLLPTALMFAETRHRPAPTIEFEEESVYNTVRVKKYPKGERALLINEGIGAQSLYHPSRVLTGYYWDGAALLPLLRPQGKRFLIVGLAGGTSARVLSHFFPDLALEGVEIDPLIVEVGKNFFGLNQVPIEIHLGDGRLFLEKTDGRYDFIMVDVYHDNLYIPFHLATREFFETVKARLTPEGGMVMNVFSPSPEGELLGLLKNTLGAVFPFVYEFRVRKIGSLLYAFPEKPDADLLSTAGLPPDLGRLASKILSQWKPVSFNPSTEVSRDNRPTVEFLSAKMVFSGFPREAP